MSRSGSKGQIIAKGFLVSSISSKKRTKEFDFTTMIPQVDLFLFVFLEEIKDTKKPFWNYWTFRCPDIRMSQHYIGSKMTFCHFSNFCATLGHHKLWHHVFQQLKHYRASNLTLSTFVLYVNISIIPPPFESNTNFMAIQFSTGGDGPNDPDLKTGWRITYSIIPGL